jgi:MORN repeat
MRESEGTMKWNDGSEFSGEWRLDQRHKGKMIMSDGTIFEGEFRDD